MRVAGFDMSHDDETVQQVRATYQQFSTCSASLAQADRVRYVHEDRMFCVFESVSTSSTTPASTSSTVCINQPGSPAYIFSNSRFKQYGVFSLDFGACADISTTFWFTSTVEHRRMIVRASRGNFDDWAQLP